MQKYSLNQIPSIPSTIYRGYDIRAIAETELTDNNVEAFIRAYATTLLQKRIFDCVVGHYCRLSSPRIKSLVTSTLAECGINVCDIGLTLSQIGYFAQYYFRSKGLVMITASHNPKEYNGFKLGAGFSDTLIGDEVQELRRIIEQNEYLKVESPGEITTHDIKEIYTEDLFKRVGKIKKFKVLIDSCGATTGAFLPDILRRAGCEVVEQNTTPDGNFLVGTPDPTESEAMHRLGEGVIANNCDLGFSYDCDGDRVGIVDEEGRIIWNDNLVSIFALDVLDFLPGSKIIYNVLCSKQVDEVIRSKGGKPIMWLTGHSFIKAKVKEERAVFGGELSGHFFFMDNFYGHDDGAMASLRLLAYLTRINKSLKEVFDELPSYYSSPEIKVGCPDDIKFGFVQNELKKEVEKLLINAEYITIDGIRADTKDEMIVIRASQNGPYLTIRFEARDKVRFNEIRKQIHNLIKKFDVIDLKSGTNLGFLDNEMK